LFRFTTRELMGLLLVAAVSFGIGAFMFPGNQQMQVMCAIVALLFGGGCYLFGVMVGRGGPPAVG
jgi:hypothetical protein